jgi:hypothetical protein
MSNEFSPVTGKATNILWIDPDGLEISLSKVTGWNWKPDVKKVESTGLDGVREILPAYNGCSGSFSAELRDRGLYDFFAARQQEYKQSSKYRYSTFVAYITYQDQSIQALTFTGVTAVFDDAGDFKNEDTVKLKVSWESQDVSGQ